MAEGVAILCDGTEFRARSTNRVLLGSEACSKASRTKREGFIGIRCADVMVPVSG